MLNSSDILRGYTDTIILAQLAGGDSYGYVISKNVQEITRGELQLKEATLYTTCLLYTSGIFSLPGV